MIISLHLPKTAGMSFRRSLQDYFGKSLVPHYDYPLNYPEYERCRNALQTAIKIAEHEGEPPKCIHGHFLPVTYLLLAVKRDLKFITWMRNPVDRAVSHYNFWVKVYDPELAPPLLKKMAEENWSLERFCLGEEFRNIYSQYLWGFPFERFDFIGIAESYDDDLAYFSREYLDDSLVSYSENVAEKKGGRYEIDADLRKRIEAHHSKDMELYEKALQLQKLRTQSGS